MRDTVVPVEMRSPRHDGESRSSMKGKRNARVFVFPQSDESETDNIVPPKDKPKLVVWLGDFVNILGYKIIKRNDIILYGLLYDNHCL